MKKRSFLVLALVAIVAGLYVSTTATAANVVKRLQGGYVFDAVQTLTGGLKIGATGASITTSYAGCDAVSDAAAGTWTAVATAASSSASYTLTGAAVGDACVMAYGAAVSATNQGLVWQCKVESTNTIRERVSNATGATITPKTGKRCARTFAP